METSYRPPEGSVPWHNADPNAIADPFKMNYKVADFGVDHDIIATQKHISDQEKRLKSKLNVDPKVARAF